MTTVKQVQNILRLTFGIVPIVAGLDKFANLLTHWSDYLNPALAGLLPVNTITFMKIVGVIEMVAGIIVLIRPLAGAYIVMAWLICIALQLIAGGHYLDVAVRDLVMAMGAFTLAKLTLIAEPELKPAMLR
ncbi:MAG TPA: hypothetical protein VFI33_20775 [Puia sp.]|nr:hypothetical protein [Puia sp.]